MWKTRSYPIPILLLSVSFLLFLTYQEKVFSQANRYLGKKITLIDFKGNEHVSTPELYAGIDLRPGDKLTNFKLNQALKTIYKNEYISDVRMEARNYKDGVAITIHIKERPIITKVVMKGVDEINEAELADVIPLKVNRIFNEQALVQSIRLMRIQYSSKGFYNVSIRYNTTKDPRKKNGVNIIFVIDEGEEIKVGKLNVIGNKNIDAEDIYKIMKLEEDSFFTEGNFDEKNFQLDQQSIPVYMKTLGYLDAELLDVKKEIRWKNKTEKIDRVLVITYKVKEGEKYYFNGYHLEWDQNNLNRATNKQLITEKQLRKLFEFGAFDLGNPLDYGKYMRDRGTISFQYSEKGYIFNRVIPKQTVIRLTPEEINKLEKSDTQVKFKKQGLDYFNIATLRKIYKSNPKKRGKKFMHIKLTIAEGARGYIENIIVKGNEKTKDKVIRREILVKPGELFNAELVQRSREKIYNLGYFSAVNLDTRPGSSEGKLNLIIHVEEQLTGQLSLGGGYGSLTGFSIFTEIGETNVRGSGQTIKGKFQFGLQEVGLDLSWTEPWMFDTPWALTLRGFYNQSRRFAPSLSLAGSSGLDSYYYFEQFGPEVQVGHKLGVDWVHYHRISPVFSQVKNPSSLVIDEIYLLENRGMQISNTLTNGIVYDNRDNKFNPTNGFFWHAKVAVTGGVFGGQDHYNRYSSMFEFYWWPFDYTFFNLIRKGVLRRWRAVFQHRFSVTYTQQTAPVYGSQDVYENPYVETFDKLYIGGYESLRGWLLYDSLFPDAWNNGGSHRVLYSTELRLPLEPSTAWLVIFFDAGAVFNELSQYYVDSSTPDSYIKQLEATEWNSKNVFSGSYYRYSWGFGLRIHLAVMPIRLFVGQRLLYDANAVTLKAPPAKEGFQFVFGIGDNRF